MRIYETDVVGINLYPIDDKVKFVDGKPTYDGPMHVTVPMPQRCVGFDTELTIISGHIADDLRWRDPYTEPPSEGQICVVYDNITEEPSIGRAMLSVGGNLFLGWGLTNSLQSDGMEVMMTGAHTRYRPLTKLDTP